MGLESSTEPQIDPSASLVQADIKSTHSSSLKGFWNTSGSGDQAQTQRAVMPKLLLLLGYITACILIFAIALLVPYGFTDSYNVLAAGLQGTINQYDLQLVTYGRPVYALLAHLAFSSMQSIDDFRYLRLAAAIGTGILAWVLYQALRLAGFRRPYALTLPLLICTTPPYEVYVGWEDCAFFPYAAILAGAALILADRAVKKRFSRQGLLFGSVSVTLLSIALMIYQPAAMVFWVFAAIFLFGRSSSLRSTAKRFGAYGMVLIVTLGVDYAAAKILPEILYGTLYPGSRTSLVTQPFTKALWFVREPLVNALNLWNLVPHIRIAGVIAIFLLTGLLMFLPGTLADRSGKFLIALALIPLSYLPNLVVQENWATYRTQVALTSLMVLYGGFALLGWLSFAFQTKALQRALRMRQRSLRKLQRTLAATVLIVGVVVGSLLAASNVTTYFALSQAEELSIMASQLNSTSLANATSIYIIPCARDDGLTPVVRYDEFGRPSCSQSWALRPMAYLLLRKLHPAKMNIPIIIALPGKPINPPPGSLVIDMRTLKTYRIAAISAGASVSLVATAKFLKSSTLYGGGAGDAWATAFPRPRAWLVD